MTLNERAEAAARRLIQMECDHEKALRQERDSVRHEFDEVRNNKLSVDEFVSGLRARRVWWRKHRKSPEYKAELRRYRRDGLELPKMHEDEWYFQDICERAARRLVQLAQEYEEVWEDRGGPPQCGVLRDLIDVACDLLDVPAGESRARAKRHFTAVLQGQLDADDYVERLIGVAVIA
jgi:hypothetical protein